VVDGVRWQAMAGPVATEERDARSVDVPDGHGRGGRAPGGVELEHLDCALELVEPRPADDGDLGPS
jgi:hypothetical protein